MIVARTGLISYLFFYLHSFANVIHATDVRKTKQKHVTIRTVIIVFTVMSQLKQIFFIRGKIHGARDVIVDVVVVVIGDNLMYKDVTIIVFIYSHLIWQANKSDRLKKYNETSSLILIAIHKLGVKYYAKVY